MLLPGVSGFLGADVPVVGVADVLLDAGFLRSLVASVLVMFFLLFRLVPLVSLVLLRTELSISVLSVLFFRGFVLGGGLVHTGPSFFW